RVHDSRYAEGSDRECGAHERSPRGAHDRRSEERRAEVHDGRRAEGCNLAAAGFRAGIRDECDDDELESRQRGGRRADDDVEILPIGKRRLGGNGHHAMGGSGGGPARINWGRQSCGELLRRRVIVTNGLPSEVLEGRGKRSLALAWGGAPLGEAAATPPEGAE